MACALRETRHPGSQNPRCADRLRCRSRAVALSTNHPPSNRRASLTPGPPPFSGMNSMPAASSAVRIAFRFAEVIDGMPSSDSARLTVATPKLAASARSFALQRSSARAARICAPVMSFISCDCKTISNRLEVRDYSREPSAVTTVPVGAGCAQVWPGDMRMHIALPNHTKLLGTRLWAIPTIPRLCLSSRPGRNLREQQM
ncbi:hypothetical protein C8D77_13315 [Mesorhizobium loti]|uniref:Uncharacterized protein n=1 Tax=Rhizobium loti TaxID=381 RepID=A0A8E2W792_RHILI|nr:hypothetical protein C8D77_13315 [Mesorhizobium loti]